VWAYQLAVVVDDAAMGITEVVRGSDLLPSTAAQLLLYGALGLTPPLFAHVAPLGDGAGERLAKRRGSLTLHQLQQAGVRPERVVGLLAHGLGLMPERAEIGAAELLGIFSASLTEFPTGRFTPADQQWLLAGAA
jgi:glutamyl-tRNA synthetase